MHSCFGIRKARYREQSRASVFARLGRKSPDVLRSLRPRPASEARRESEIPLLPSGPASFLARKALAPPGIPWQRVPIEWPLGLDAGRQGSRALRFAA